MTVYTGVNSDGSSSYMDATAANLTTYQGVSTTDKQRFIENASGQVLVTQSVSNALDKAGNDAGDISTYADVNAYLDAKLGGHVASATVTQANINTYTDIYNSYTTSNAAYLTDGYNTTDAAKYATSSAELTAFLKESGVETDSSAADYDQGKVTYYTNIFNQAATNGYTTDGTGSDTDMTNSDWLQAQISAGNLSLYEYDPTGGSNGTGDFVNVSWTSGDSALQEQTDTTDTAKAEAQYEATMADIQSKDNRFDLQLKNIDTEHTAVQTEIDSVSKVIDKNIERSFKIFDA